MADPYFSFNSSNLASSRSSGQSDSSSDMDDRDTHPNTVRYEDGMCKYSTNYNEMSGVVESAAVGAMVNDSWTRGSAGPFATIKLAIAEAKASENGKWKYDKPSGNGTRNVYFVCKEHEACKRKMKVQVMDSTFHIFYKGEHAKVVTFGARKNSKLSWAQEEHLKKHSMRAASLDKFE